VGISPGSYLIVWIGKGSYISRRLSIFHPSIGKKGGKIKVLERSNLSSTKISYSKRPRHIKLVGKLNRSNLIFLSKLGLFWG